MLPTLITTGRAREDSEHFFRDEKIPAFLSAYASFTFAYGSVVVEALARGRVYTGTDAHAAGLVDVLGFDVALREVKALLPDDVPAGSARCGRRAVRIAASRAGAFAVRAQRAWRAHPGAPRLFRPAVLSVTAMFAALSACVLGFASGMRHALEPDHLAAVSTLVAGHRHPVRYALAWGAGHGLMLVLAGGALALFRAQLPDVVSDAFELVVAVALVVLGVRGLVVAARAGRVGPTVMHRHGDVAHVHAGPGDHLHVNRFTLARLPFAIGLLHGLAGSGALAALVVARTPSPVFGLSFIAVYALGAALGMTALAGVLGLPLARLAKSQGAMTFAVGLSALASLVVGIAWAAPIVARLV